MLYMAAFATSLLSSLDPYNKSDPSPGLELGLGLGLEGASTHRAPAPHALARGQESDYCTTFSGNNAIVMITL